MNQILNDQTSERKENDNFYFFRCHHLKLFNI